MVLLTNVGRVIKNTFTPRGGSVPRVVGSQGDDGAPVYNTASGYAPNEELAAQLAGEPLYAADPATIDPWNITPPQPPTFNTQNVARARSIAENYNEDTVTTPTSESGTERTGEFDGQYFVKEFDDPGFDDTATVPMPVDGQSESSLARRMGELNILKTSPGAVANRNVSLPGIGNENNILNSEPSQSSKNNGVTPLERPMDLDSVANSLRTALTNREKEIQKGKKPAKEGKKPAKEGKKPDKMQGVEKSARQINKERREKKQQAQKPTPMEDVKATPVFNFRGRKPDRAPPVTGRRPRAHTTGNVYEGSLYRHPRIKHRAGNDRRIPIYY